MQSRQICNSGEVLFLQTQWEVGATTEECPDWPFSNYRFSYQLPDGATADFANFNGTADFTDQTDVKVTGTASCKDSTGATVQVYVKWEWAASCKSGRDGGCRKTFLLGTLTVAK